MRSSGCAIAAAAALWIAACGQSHEIEDAGSEAPEARGPLGMMGILGGPSSEPAPYAEPMSSEDFDATEAHFAVVELAQPVVELSSLSLFGPTGVELRQVLDALRRLAESEQVEGLLLRLDEPQLSLAAAEELRGALLSFKESGPRERPLLCHAERASAITYFVLTACDHIGLAPLGEIAIPGVTATPIHIRNLLDKIGVTPQFTEIGDHKTAAEPLTREGPSPALEQTLGEVLDTRYRTLVRAIAEGRDLSTAQARALIDGAVYQDQRASQAQLVDAVATFSSYRERILDGSPWRREPLDGNAEGSLDDLMRLVGLSPQPRPRGERVAIVYMVGAVVESDGRGAGALREEVAARRLVSAIRVLAEDDAVKAVVIRIDSPGGSALASEQVWLALRELAERKPLIASMGQTAASGGYYIASPAHTIYALENTLTGSIGVVGGKLVIDEGLDTIGVDVYPMGRGDLALLASPFRLWSDEELELVESLMQTTYDRFLERVAEGRGLERDAVERVAGGRLWTGAAAAEHDLVDRIGGLEDALAEARARGGVDAAAPLEVYPPEPSILDVLGFEALGVGAGSSRWGGGAASAMLRARVAAVIGDSPHAEAVFELVALAMMFSEAPVAATAFSAAALR
jgi:protease IV